MLIGVGGSGKQSLIRLITFMRGMQYQSIEITKNFDTNAFKELVKGYMKQAGGCGEGSPRLPQPRGAEPAAGEESPTGVTVPLPLASDSTHGVGS